MAKRVKKTVITGMTAVEAEEAFAAYSKADAQQSKITAEIELACARIREKYQDRLTTLQAEKEAAFDRLQAYATENQEELFAKKKSLEMTHGVIGFRTGTPKLKTAKGFTWAACLTLVKEILPEYVRITEEIAKDRMLADRDGELIREGKAEAVSVRGEMIRCGILVAQEESFFVEPKREDIV